MLKLIIFSFYNIYTVNTIIFKLLIMMIQLYFGKVFLKFDSLKALVVSIPVAVILFHGFKENTFLSAKFLILESLLFILASLLIESLKVIKLKKKSFLEVILFLLDLKCIFN